MASINPLNFRNTSIYNSADQTVASVDPLLRRSSMFYDAAGQMKASISPLLNRTTMIYDALGRKMAVRNASTTPLRTCMMQQVDQWLVWMR
ncbi:MAG: RHS repeat domain-containing protein [Gemmatales bacterium]